MKGFHKIDILHCIKFSSFHFQIIQHKNRISFINIKYQYLNKSKEDSLKEKTRFLSYLKI